MPRINRRTVRTDPARVDQIRGQAYGSNIDHPSTPALAVSRLVIPRVVDRDLDGLAFPGMGGPMCKPTKICLGLGVCLAIVVLAPFGVWKCLTYQPSYYLDMIRQPRDQSVAGARRFAAQSLQLRNDICNEPNWEAVFSDQEVNAWLAEDLVAHFADQLPPEVSNPRVMFELDRITLLFLLKHRGVESVITVVARPRVPEGNTVELTLERIRAGVLPVPADAILEQIVQHVRYQGVDVKWFHREGCPVVVVRYMPKLDRDDVRLEELQIRSGQIRLAGKSDMAKGSFPRPSLPSRRVLQSKFPNRKIHVSAPAASEASNRISTAPTS